MSEQMFKLINDFYDNVSVKYSEYHNKVTTPNLLKIVFRKKQNYKEISDYYQLLFNKLNVIINKVNLFENEIIKDDFLYELRLFENILNNEINLYRNNDFFSELELKELSSKRLSAQQEFLAYDIEIFRNKMISQIH